MKVAGSVVSKYFADDSQSVNRQPQGDDHADIAKQCLQGSPLFRRIVP